MADHQFDAPIFEQSGALPLEAWFDPNYGHPYPQSIDWSGFWRANYSGSPWVGTVSSGASYYRTLAEATNPPSTGTAQNGYTPALFDGTNDELTTGVTFTSGHFLEDFASLAHGWTYHAVVKFLSLGADDNFYDEDALIVQDGSSSIGITAAASGVRAHQYSTGFPDYTPYVAVGTTDYHRIQARWSAATTTLEIRVDGGAWSGVSMPDLYDAPGRVMRVGANYAAAAHLHAEFLEHGMVARPMSDAELDRLDAEAVDRYALGGSTPAVATLSATLPAVTLASTATARVQATASPTLGAVTLSATATAKAKATLSATLAAVTLASTATARVQATLGATLGNVTTTSAAVAPVVATVGATLGPVTAAATAAAPAVATLGAMLGDLTLAATAVGVDVLVAELDATLAAVTLSSTATARASATLSATLAPVTLAATATARAAATLSATLGPVTGTGTAVAPAQAALGATLGPVTASATAAARAVAVVDATIGPVLAQGAAVVPGVATLGATLADVTLAATGTAQTGSDPIIVASLRAEPHRMGTVYALASEGVRADAAPMLGVTLDARPCVGVRVLVLSDSDEVAA